MKKGKIIIIALLSLFSISEGWSQIVDTVDIMKEFRFKVLEVNGFENAQVSCGGVDTKDVNPHTMESLIVKNLYFAGELLDVDGICGGYNLHFAWATGNIAGNNIK